MNTLIDYTKEFKKYHPELDVLLAQGKGKHMLILCKLDEPKIILKKTCRYMLEYRELSVECENQNDQAFVCVWSDEQTFYMRKEIKELLNDMKLGNVDIFYYFYCFNIF